MKRLAWLLGGPGLLLVPGVTVADLPEPVSRQARAILQAHCADCHGGGKAVKGGFGFVLDRDQLVQRLLVVPGQSNQSELFLRVHKGDMPPASRKSRPTEAELRVLRQWIDGGAAPFEARAVTATLPPADIVLADLRQLDPRRRRFTRYLTLGHLAQAGRGAKDLDTTHEAAGKLLNSLSWHPRLTLPQPVDDAATVLRFDLRDYKWHVFLWEKVVTAYPYRPSTTETTRQITSLSGTDVAFVRADWFVANASRPPLYHDLLQMPATDRGLERLVQVDVPANQQDDNVVRAGFNDSGVSKNNRLLERHDAAHGALWRSYDFAGNTGRQNLFEHPVGPHTGDTSFQPAGGEVIFHLPNGLQAYLLVDGAGRRIDKAPSEIVADPRRPDQRVETGISCMSCHARGLLPKIDQVRPHVEKNAERFGQRVVELVRATHPGKVRFQARIDEDNVRYLKALAQFGVRDPDQEPVNLVTQRFEATLDGTTAAAELGLSLAELGVLLNTHPALARTFGSLLVRGGTVQREVFQENFPDLVSRLTASQIARSRTAPSSSFLGHTGTVNCVAFSSDGSLAASGSDDGTIRLWSVPDGREVGTFTSGSEVYAVAFSRDGKALLGAGRDRLVRLWDLRKNKLTTVWRGHTDSVRCLAFSPDGMLAVSGGDDRAVRIWDVATGVEKWSLAGHTGAVTSAAWSDDSQHLLTGSLDGTLCYWDTGLRPRWRLEGHNGSVLAVALAPGKQLAASGGNDKTVRLWDLASGKEVHTLTGHASAVIQVRFAADKLYSAGSQHQGTDRNWRIWDLAARKELASLAAGEGISVGCSAFSPDGRHVLAGGPGGFLRLWTWQK